MLNVAVFGDFNCPFSALASARADRKVAQESWNVDWRPVEHNRSRRCSVSLSDQERDAYSSELQQVRDLLHEGEPDVLRVPSVSVCTREANVRFAALPLVLRASFRRAVFDAYWVHGSDIGSGELLDELCISIAGGAFDPQRLDDARSTCDRWQQEWESLTSPIVPAMRLPDGYVSRGLGVLSRLA